MPQPSNATPTQRRHAPGATLRSIAGAIATGIVISVALHGIAIPGRHATHLATVLYAIPGALAGMALIYAVGAARERSSQRLADGPFGG